MPDAIVYIALVIVCSVAAIGGARALGSRAWHGGVITGQARSDWPRGIQEQDVPHFAIGHADALRRGFDDGTGMVDLEAGAEVPTAETVELDVHPYDRPH